MDICQTYGQGIVEGSFPGHSIFSRCGYHPASTTSETTVWEPGTQYVFPTAPMGMEVVSTDNTNDKAAGTGCLTVTIEYLDTNYVEQTETITLTGTVVVPTVATNILRVNNFYGNTFGSTGKAAGTISLRHLADTPIYAQILPGFTQARSSFYTVPADKSLYVTEFRASSAGAAASKYIRATFHTSLRPDNVVGLTGLVFYPQIEVILLDNLSQYRTDFPLEFPAKTDIKVSIIGVAGALVTTQMQGWLDTGAH